MAGYAFRLDGRDVSIGSREPNAASIGGTMSEPARVFLEQAARARRSWRLLYAHRDFLEAVTLSRETGARPDLIHALKGLGQIERDLGHGDAARPLYEEAVALCRLEDNPLQLAHTVRHLGDIHQDAGRLDLAEPCYREALTIYQGDQRTAPLDLANTLRPFALLHEKLGHTKPAIEFWTDARNLYATVNVQAGVDESAEHLTRLGRS
jgi:tetratricopeptide (TPR) repeat protein